MKTDPAVFGPLPRRYGQHVTQGLAVNLYITAAALVRSFRQGSISLALIDIQRSMPEPGCTSVLLNDPEEQWVYSSPML